MAPWGKVSSGCDESSANILRLNTGAARNPRLGIGELRESRTLVTIAALNRALCDILCECPREDCTELAPMAIEEYANMRSHPTFFVNAPGHEAVKGENDVVVERTEAYVIVDEAGPSRDLVIGDWAGSEQR